MQKESSPKQGIHLSFPSSKKRVFATFQHSAARPPIPGARKEKTKTKTTKTRKHAPLVSAGPAWDLHLAQVAGLETLGVHPFHDLHHGHLAASAVGAERAAFEAPNSHYGLQTLTKSHYDSPFGKRNISDRFSGQKDMPLKREKKERKKASDAPFPPLELSKTFSGQPPLTVSWLQATFLPGAGPT